MRRRTTEPSSTTVARARAERDRARPPPLVASLVAACLLVAAAVVGAESLVTIGTAGITGVYYPAGGAVCRMVNRHHQRHDVRCTVQTTGGSLDNLARLERGTLEVAVVQSDLLHHAYVGSGPFATRGPNPALRALLAMHPEPFTVVARADAGIRHVRDLRGKRVNLGNPGSGQRATMEVVMQALGWTAADFALATELASQEQAHALCDGRIDAIVFTVGHPNGSIKEATTSCDSVIVEVSGPAIDALVRDQPYYRHAVIPGGMYRASPRAVPTFGVGAILVATAEMPAATARAIVRSVLDGIDDIRVLHPAFAGLEPATMARDALAAPVHEGAAAEFRARGLGHGLETAPSR
ncbi:MAG: TAXI family TRAP transporter solute-binding subunit [Ectothiorhodospiraceae bacterium]|nr:TAXI family TRAP transporter solute-binding subunit [Chromatiales bacterium]MCP5156825.1 TAXI family TRAP transporter solute-binding subunit [Ectothiorhodospiraceae bacterium]